VPRPSAYPYARRRRTALIGSLVAVLVLGAVAALVLRHGSSNPRRSAPTASHAPPTPGATPTSQRSRTTVASRVPTPALAGIPVGRWTTLPAAPHSRGEVSAVLVGNDAYVVGGFDAGGHSTALVERLDLLTGHWAVSPPLPVALNHMSAVGYRGRLYVVGGYSQTGDTSAGAVRAFWRFDPATQRWSAMPPAPLARAAAGAAVLGHRLYVAGGRSDDHPTIATLAIFDFDTGRWSLGPPLHHAREHVAAVAAGGSVWLLGGRALGLGNFADVERYRPGVPSWQRMAPMPIARSGFQAVDAAGHVVVVGGEGPAGTIGEVDELNPGTGRWSRLPDLPTPRHGLGLVADGELVYAIEGGPEPGLTTSRTVERLRVR
jgi:hypothetical protein